MSGEQNPGVQISQESGANCVPIADARGGYRWVPVDRKAAADLAQRSRAAQGLPANIQDAAVRTRTLKLLLASAPIAYPDTGAA